MAVFPLVFSQDKKRRFEEQLDLQDFFFFVKWCVAHKPFLISDNFV